MNFDNMEVVSEVRPVFRKEVISEGKQNFRLEVINFIKLANEFEVVTFAQKLESYYKVRCRMTKEFSPIAFSKFRLLKTDRGKYTSGDNQRLSLGSYASGDHLRNNLKRLVKHIAREMKWGWELIYSLIKHKEDKDNIII